MRPEITVLIVGLGIGVVTMPVYAAVRRGRRDPLASPERGSFVLGSWMRDWFYWFLGPLERTSLTVGLEPLFFSLTGVACGALGGVAFALGYPGLGGWAVLAGGVADILDGRIARAQGIASRRGAFLDSMLDRFAELAAYVGLAVRFAGSSWVLTLVVAGQGGSLLVSYARARGESVGVLCKLGVMQRAERLILLGIGGILDATASAVWPAAPWSDRDGGVVLVPVLALIALGTLGTAVFRTVWIARRLPRVDPPAPSL